LHRILIADDESNIRNVLEFSLQAEGLDVIEAASGDEALKLATAELPDLVILDVMMPGMGGVEVCRLLKADPRTARIPVVLLTARTQSEDRRAGLAAGAERYITKPFSPHKVVSVVAELLGVAR